MDYNLANDEEVALACLLGPADLGAKEPELLGVEEGSTRLNSHAKDDRKQAIAKLEVVKAEKDKEIVLEKMRAILGRELTQVELSAVDLAIFLATKGAGEKQALHGLLVITGDGKEVLKCGKVKKKS